MKVLVIGDYSVGKSTLINYICYGTICENIKPTIGFRCVPYKDITFYDVSGQKSFSDQLYELLINECDLIVICMNLNDPLTLQFAKEWVDHVKNNSEKKIVLAILKYSEKNDPLYKLHGWTKDIPVVKCNVKNNTGIEHFITTVSDFKKSVMSEWDEINLNEEKFENVNTTDKHYDGISCIPIFWNSDKNTQKSWYQQVYENIKTFLKRIFRK